MIRVLVADDHPIVRAGIVAMLSAAIDVEVVDAVENGFRAVERAAALRPDVVLMDLRMPDLGGAAATEQIVTHDPTVRVIVLTTYESDEAILEAIGAGASGYLLKAAPEAEILEGLRSVASGGTVLAPDIAAALVRGMRQQQTTPKLTARELEVLALVADGQSNPAIAKRLFLGEATVKTNLLHVFEKLDVSDRTRAVTRALELGLLPRR